MNLGGAAASLYALGYGRHEPAPARLLPFFAAFLAAMNLMPLASNAFTFLFSWASMSLASWALVMAEHPRQVERAAHRRLGRSLCLREVDAARATAASS